MHGVKHDPSSTANGLIRRLAEWCGLYSAELTLCEAEPLRNGYTHVAFVVDADVVSSAFMTAMCQLERDLAPEIKSNLIFRVFERQNAALRDRFVTPKHRQSVFSQKT